MPSSTSPHAPEDQKGQADGKARVAKQDRSTRKRTSSSGAKNKAGKKGGRPKGKVVDNKLFAASIEMASEAGPYTEAFQKAKRAFLRSKTKDHSSHVRVPAPPGYRVWHEVPSTERKDFFPGMKCFILRDGAIVPFWQGARYIGPQKDEAGYARYLVLCEERDGSGKFVKLRILGTEQSISLAVPADFTTTDVVPTIVGMDDETTD